MGNNAVFLFVIKYIILCKNRIKFGKSKKFGKKFGDDVLSNFFESEIGMLWLSLPLGSLSGSVRLPEPKSNAGRRGFLDVEGAISLLFLKHHYQLPDADIIETLNGSMYYQIFCGINLLEGQVIKDITLLSRWRTKLGLCIDFSLFQSILQHHWQVYMKDKHVNKQDATVIESFITYPTCVKLLWRASENLVSYIKYICKALALPQPRLRFKEQKQQQRKYQLLKKPSKKQQKKRQKSLLVYVEKLIGLVEGLGISQLKPHHQARFQIIQQMHQQQREYVNDPDSKIPNRIVSLHKPYVRPIVRGKENKAVEFGAKIHIYQVDNYEFIEHISFDNFNETTRFQVTIQHHQDHISPVKQVAADKIYWSNKNRKMCSENNIFPNFDPKGRPLKDSTQVKQNKKLRQKLSVDRGTRLEGAFGNVKLHYLGKNNMARTQKNETLWIYFSIHTANANKIKKLIPKLDAEILAVA